jgi:uncharacterized protein YecE (DUF72 family)
LEYLSGIFDVVEIKQSFHQPLKPELARVWVRKVAANPRFRFTAKLRKLFTHERVLTQEDVDAFKRGLEPIGMAGRLGCVLMQFPWSFRFTAENRDFLIRLRRTFHEFPLAAEMRHCSWTVDEALGTFLDYKIGFCNIDQPEYTKAMPATAFLTSAIGYVRLHGRNCFQWYAEPPDIAKQPRYDYEYSVDELTEWKSRIERISRCAAATYVIFNNDAGGKAVLNARQLQHMIVDRPAQQELGSPVARRPTQNALFTKYSGKVA